MAIASQEVAIAKIIILRLNFFSIYPQKELPLPLEKEKPSASLIAHPRQLGYQPQQFQLQKGTGNLCR